MSIMTPNFGGSLSNGCGEIDAINLADYENFDIMSWAIDFDLGNNASNWTVT